MRAKPAGDSPAPLSRTRALVLLVGLQLIALVLWLAFAQVAHYGYRNYFILMALAWAGGAALTALAPGLRWFWFAFIGLAFSRVAGIVLQAPTHNLVFPWLAGLALGLLLRLAISALRGSISAALQTAQDASARTFLEKMEVPPALRAGPGATLLLFGGFLLIGALRAFFEAYSPYVLFGLPIMDLEMAPGVSANYGFALSMLLILNLAGPLLFYFASHIYARSGGDARASIPRQLLVGIAGAALLHLSALVYESLGFVWLAAGAGDFWEQAGRLPGILTDSGASTLLTPLLVASLAFAAYHASVAWLFTDAPSSRFRRYVLPGLTAAALCLAVMFPLSYWHGRAFLINVGAVFAFALLILCALLTRAAAAGAGAGDGDGDAQARPTRRGRRIIIATASCAAIAVAAMALHWFFRNSSIPAIAYLRSGIDLMLPRLARGEWYMAFALLDPARTDYFLFGGRLFLESPWIGHGLNSFQVELTRFAGEAPTMLIDNPGSLPVGLLSDGGLVGAGLFSSLGVWIGVGFARLWRGGDSVRLWLAGLPFALLPAMLLGYHLVLSEFCVLLLIPFFIYEAGGGVLRTRWASALHAFAATLAALWLLGSALHFASATGGPELWRSHKTGRPQPALSGQPSR